jgi:flagellar operon protein
MVDKIQVGSIGAVDKVGGNRSAGRGSEDGPSFEKVLGEKFQKQGVKFSAHAQERLKARNIELSQDEMGRINEAVAKAANKGGRETLILLGRTALVVSIKNQTVITAMDETQMRENVFTNIDSAVIL